ncbi:MAG: dihydroneopterin aldolase [Cytophagales bacterium]|nr:dihydroneopterin aldolase [Cytophagales bacterium]
MTGTISLQGLEFFAYHGFYSEERVIGNKYEIDLIIHADLQDSPITDELSGTINYEKLYKIVKKEVDIPSKLLENLGYRILNAIFTNFDAIIDATVTVAKHNPPVGGICHKAKITLYKSGVE